jgi:2-keto-3-deoxy-L-rhamnonate aldolase RhmA
VVEVAALAGFDFVICDPEHGQMGEGGARRVILAGRAAGLPVAVRAAELERGSINRLLEAGAAGLQAPRVRTRAEVERLRDLALYPPHGSRSVSLAHPMAGYGSVPPDDYLARSQGQVLLVGQFETARVGNGPLLEAIGGLDVAFIGVFDLSVDLGLPGRFDAPEVRRWVEGLAEAAEAAGVALGLYAPTAEAAVAAARSGFKYIALGSDVTVLQQAFRNLAGAVKGP